MTIIRSSMAAFRAARQQVKPKAASGGRSRVGYLDFWSMEPGQQFSFRLLPNKTGDAPWVEKKVIKLPFDGVIGGDYPTLDPVTVQVQCIEHHGMVCPITQMNKPIWKADPDEGRKRWRKLSHLVQGFLIGPSPLPDLVPHESGIWKLDLFKSIFEPIESFAYDSDAEFAMWDPEEGREIVVSKSKRGEFASYNVRASLKSRALSTHETDAVEKHGLFELRDELGPVPDAAAIDIIRQLGEDSIAGLPYDAEKYNPHGYRAWKANGNFAGAASPAQAPRSDVMAQLLAKNRSSGGQ